MKSNFEEKFEQMKKNSNAEESFFIETQKQLFNYPSPTEYVDLPSLGRFYGEGHPLHNKTSIEVREMTAKEEDILTNRSYAKKGLIVDKLLESIIVDKSIKVGSLLVGDRNAVLVAARINAYGPTYDIITSCLNCSARNTLNINLNEIKKTYAIEIPSEDQSAEISKNKNGNIFITLPKTKWIVECHLLNGSDEQKIFNIAENKRIRNETQDMTIIEQLDLIIESINYVKDSDILKSALESMPASDAKFLRDKYYSIVPNISITSQYVCSSCSGEQETEVPFTEEFFWPK